MSTPPPFQLLGLDHVVLRVREPQRALHFYTEVLGGSLDRVQEAIGLVQVRVGRSLVDLLDVNGTAGRAGGTPPDVQAPNMDHFCLRVQPFDGETIMAWLQSRGIEVEAPAQRYGADGTGPSVYLRDPEGNRVELKGPPV